MIYIIVLNIVNVIIKKNYIISNIYEFIYIYIYKYIYIYIYIYIYVFVYV